MQRAGIVVGGDALDRGLQSRRQRAWRRAAAGELGEDRWIVQRPGHGVARARHDHRRRRGARWNHRRLSARDPQLALGILQQHLAIEHHHLGALRADADQELRALCGRVDERRVDLQRARAMAEEVDAAQDQIDQRAPFLGDAAQLQRRALVEAQGRIIGERQRGAARPTYPQRVAQAQGLAQHRGGPHVSARAFQLDGALDRDQTRVRRLAEDLRVGRARQHQQRPCQGERGKTAVKRQSAKTGPRAHARPRKPLLLSRLESQIAQMLRITWIELRYNGVSHAIENQL